MGYDYSGAPRFELSTQDYNEACKAKKDEPTVSTCNVIVSTSFGCELDLLVLYMELGESCCKYVPSQFHGLIYRTTQCTMNVYANGSVMCTGSKSSEVAEQCLTSLADVVRSFGFNVSKRLLFKVGNRVGSFVVNDKCKSVIRKLYTNADLFHQFSKNNLVIYAPDRFCGMTWYCKNGTAVILFVTGRCIITGCKSVEDRQHALTQFLGELLPLLSEIYFESKYVLMYVSNLFQRVYTKSLTAFKNIEFYVVGDYFLVVLKNEFNGQKFEMDGTQFITISEDLWVACQRARDQTEYDATVSGVKIRSQTYAGKWVIDIRRLDMDGHFTKDGFCVAQESAPALAEAVLWISDTIAPVLDYVKDMPEIWKMVLYVMYVLAERSVQMRVKANCKACVSKVGLHTECELPPWEKMAKYTRDVSGLLDLAAVNRAAYRFCADNGLDYDQKMIEDVAEKHLNSATFARFVKTVVPPQCPMMANVVKAVCKI